MTSRLTATVKSARLLMLVTGSYMLISQSALAQKGTLKPPPTHADVPYGPHPRNVLDFWQAEGPPTGPAGDLHPRWRFP